ncbi:unnamed protein product [Protopolystoma xenopodis]|uniref:Uncharacterized protein n=1 Tax=Protopolystoma xenopodis TaxID=117903 RepID=A0A448WFG7_9PLAT|nr:unnamed protein product [Protopolystoma xenopodis]
MFGIREYFLPLGDLEAPVHIWLTLGLGKCCAVLEASTHLPAIPHSLHSSSANNTTASQKMALLTSSSPVCVVSDDGSRSDDQSLQTKSTIGIFDVNVSNSTLTPQILSRLIPITSRVRPRKESCDSTEVLAITPALNGASASSVTSSGGACNNFVPTAPSVAAPAVISPRLFHLSPAGLETTLQAVLAALSSPLPSLQDAGMSAGLDLLHSVNILRPLWQAQSPSNLSGIKMPLHDFYLQVRDFLFFVYK